uniref:Uncharacterized protein n=1 Tax=Papilio xuthus TaxID=66420 RepID=I4DLM4_PAPXU|nr:unknown unsecreted protein [Papilio xuthus]
MIVYFTYLNLKYLLTPTFKFDFTLYMYVSLPRSRRSGAEGVKLKKNKLIYKYDKFSIVDQNILILLMI